MADHAATPQPGIGKSSANFARESAWLGDKDLERQLEAQENKKKGWKATCILAFASLGVVYGDIGTSPLYVYASIFPVPPTPELVLGAFSFIFWTLTLEVLIKYVVIVLRANDHGEGGTFALYMLLCRSLEVSPVGLACAADKQLTQFTDNKQVGSSWLRRRFQRKPSGSPAHVSNEESHSAKSPAEGPNNCLPGPRTVGDKLKAQFRKRRSLQVALLVVVSLATSLVLGDGILTPTISILSAVSGLKVATTAIDQNATVGITIAILAVLFVGQSFGTAKVGVTFAPIVTLWLTCNAAIGVYSMAIYGGGVWQALNPYWIVRMFQIDAYGTWAALGAIMLCITGAEAMFADLGHFSYASVSLCFSFIAYPCLLLTYAGQAAYLMVKPEDVADTYWKTIPTPVFYPMLVLATLASVVASQALISGTFSIVRQAVNLGLLPRLSVKHTGYNVEGQVYIPFINYLLLALCIIVVIGFKSTVALGHAYGLAVMMVMAITSFLTTLVALVVWETPGWLAIPVGSFFLAVELLFLSSNLVKIPEGGWLTLTVALVVTALELVWWWASKKKSEALKEDRVGLLDLLKEGNTRGRVMTLPPPTPTIPKDGAGDDFAPKLGHISPPLVLATDGYVHRVPGIGVYYNESVYGAPPVLNHMLKRLPVLSEVVVILTIRALPLPLVGDKERFLVRKIPEFDCGFQVVVRYGYMDAISHDSAFTVKLVSALLDHLSALAAYAPSLPPNSTLVTSPSGAAFAASDPDPASLACGSGDVAHTLLGGPLWPSGPEEPAVGGNRPLNAISIDMTKRPSASPSPPHGLLGVTAIPSSAPALGEVPVAVKLAPGSSLSAELPEGIPAAVPPATAGETFLQRVAATVDVVQLDREKLAVLKANVVQVVHVLGSTTLAVGTKRAKGMWQRVLLEVYAAMRLLSESPADMYHIPPGQIINVGIIKEI